MLCSAEKEKKRKYLATIEERRASFTPFVVSVGGILGHNAQHLIKRLCDQIARERSHSELSNGMGSCQNRSCYFTCIKPSLAW